MNGTWYRVREHTILNGRYLVLGARAAGLATERAGAGGLSGSDRMVEGRLTGTEKKGLYSTWILICSISALSYRVRRYHCEGISWNICPPENNIRVITKMGMCIYGKRV
jgi:hypothetical protein